MSHLDSFIIHSFSNERIQAKTSWAGSAKEIDCLCDKTAAPMRGGAARVPLKQFSFSILSMLNPTTESLAGSPPGRRQETLPGKLRPPGREPPDKGFPKWTGLEFLTTKMVFRAAVLASEVRTLRFAEALEILNRLSLRMVGRVRMTLRHWGRSPRVATHFQPLIPLTRTTRRLPKIASGRPTRPLVALLRENAMSSERPRLVDQPAHLRFSLC